MTRRAARSRDITAELHARWAAERKRRRAAPQCMLALPGIDRPPRVLTPAARVTTRRSGRATATTSTPVPRPWLAAVLAVDTAAWSGWAVRVCGQQREFGEADTLDAAALERIVRWAVRLAAIADVPLVLVLEAPWGGAAHIVAALGAARERWLRAWRDAEQAGARVVLVKPGRWRGPVLGRRYVSAPREETRAREQLVAGGMVGCEVGSDEAPAILIGYWASHAAEVGRVIGKRAAGASVRAWQEAR